MSVCLPAVENQGVLNCRGREGGREGGRETYLEDTKDAVAGGGGLDAHVQDAAEGLLLLYEGEGGREGGREGGKEG